MQFSSSMNKFLNNVFVLFDQTSSYTFMSSLSSQPQITLVWLIRDMNQRGGNPQNKHVWSRLTHKFLLPCLKFSSILYYTKFINKKSFYENIIMWNAQGTNECFSINKQFQRDRQRSCYKFCKYSHEWREFTNLIH